MDLLGGKQEFCSKVELSISCTNLANKDLTSKSDPICVVKQKNSEGNYVEVGRTEQIKESLNPIFSKRISLKYYFEQVQDLKICIYDVDNSSSTLKDDDFLGKTYMTLGQIVSSKKKTVPLMKKKKVKSDGEITINADEVTDKRSSAFSFKAIGVDKKDLFGKSDPFLEFWRLHNDNWSLCHRTEVIDNDLNPKWKKFFIPHYLLASKEGEKQIKLVCYDADSDGSHDLIGECYVTMKQLEDSPKDGFPLINPKKKAKKKNYKHSGILVLDQYKLVMNYSFLDFLFGGLQLNFTVGIDFTISNGNPLEPRSLHYLNSEPGKLNQYQESLYAIGNIVQDYDYDKMFPAFGFGGQLPDGNVSHEFALNFNPANPYCAGIQGIAAAYQHSVHHVKLSAPTCMSPIINHVAAFAREQHSSASKADNYYVLLILTDGVITDMDETKHAICSASLLPMSIIIIGVGNANFSSMEELDGDDGVLRSPITGDKCRRDIVQFVPFNDFKRGHRQGPKWLARAVLAELPGQVTGYYKQQGIEPMIRPTN